MGMDAAFATLGLAAGAQPIEITRAFRALSRVSHPDRGGDRRRFEAVLAAYRTLQRAGLVERQSGPVIPTMPPVPATAGGAANRYRAFVRDLDRAAAMTVTPAPKVTVPRRANLTPMRPSRTGERFADILDRILAGNATAAA